MLKYEYMKHASGNLRIVFIVIATVFICTAILLLSFASLGGMSVSNIISGLCSHLYPYDNENMFFIGKINGINTNVYFYALITIASIIVLFLIGQRAKINDKIKMPSTSHVVFLVSIVVFLLAAAIQLSNQVTRFHSEIKDFSGKTVSEKYIYMFGLAYKFPVFCHKHLPGKHKGQFITSYDVNKDPGMSIRNALAYQLYPIDTMVATERPVDCYVIFGKNNLKASLPEDVKEIYYYDDFNALALKKELD